MTDALRSRPGSASPPRGTTRCRTCRRRCSHRCIPAPREPVGSRRPRAAVPDGAHRAGDGGRAVDRRPWPGARHPARCGARRPSCAPSGSSARSARRRGSTSRTNPCRPRVRTSRTPRCRKPSTTQAEGIPRLTTETGAGQWGSRTCVRVRAVRSRVQGVHGARVVRAEAVPSHSHGDVGRAKSCRHRSTTPTTPGSLGIAISDAVRDAAARDDSHYSLGSVLNHVLLHQTVIGLEAKEQLALAGEERPDVVIGVVRWRVESRRHRAAVHDRYLRFACSRSSRRRVRRSPRVVRVRLR